MRRGLCICASNVLHSGKAGTSYKLCEITVRALWDAGIQADIIDLRDAALKPCIGCGRCYARHRCPEDPDWNRLYEQIIQADVLFIVSPHYAPIPAKLCMLLEKMEQATFLHWHQDAAYRSEVYGIPTGIISHGGGEAWALESYKQMVNDTIANALDTIQLRLVGYDEEWDTGISLPVAAAQNSPDGCFPQQRYDRDALTKRIRTYVDRVTKEIRP